MDEDGGTQSPAGCCAMMKEKIIAVCGEFDEKFKRASYPGP